MGTLTEVRDGLKTRGATITGLNVYARWPDRINLPALLVQFVSFKYDEDFEDGLIYRFKLVLLGAAAQLGYDQAQSVLDAYIVPTGSSSIKAAIEGDKTLGGKADQAVVSGGGDYGVLDVNSVQYWGCSFDCEVWV